jgi:asparagine synthase (glutamine-hydrolysing)
LGLPDAAKLQGTSGKHALKQAAASLLPAELLARRKQGFSPPFSAWARGPLQPYVREVLSPERLRRAGVLDVPATTSLLEDHLSGRKDRGRTLWAVLSLQCWADHWLLGGR